MGNNVFWMLSPFVAKLLKQVDSWQSEAEHSRLPSPQSTLTDSERLDAHDSNGDSRDIILEVRANLAKSQQEHADRMARIRQDYTDGITRIEADRKFKTKPAHAATAPTGQRRISWGEHTFKSGKSAPMQRRASADVRGQRLEPTFSANTAVLQRCLYPLDLSTAKPIPTPCVRAPNPYLTRS